MLETSREQPSNPLIEEKRRDRRPNEEAELVELYVFWRGTGIMTKYWDEHSRFKSHYKIPKETRLEKTRVEMSMSCWR
jgi:hypothetical protein